MSKLSQIPECAALIDFDGRSVADVLVVLEYGDGLSIDAFTAAPAVAEMGSIVAVDLDWTIAGTVTGQALVDSIDGALALADPVDDRSLTVAGVDAARSFTLTAQNDGAPGGIDSKQRSTAIAFHPRRFWGVSDSAALDGAGVIALPSSELSAVRAKTFTLDGGASPGKYIWFAYLAALGAIEDFRIFGFSEEPVVATVSVTTGAGLTADYVVLRSAQKVFGTASVEIA